MVSIENSIVSNNISFFSDSSSKSMSWLNINGTIVLNTNDNKISLMDDDFIS